MGRVLDLDGRPDERAQGRVDVEDSEQSLAEREVGAVEDLGQDVGIEPAEVLGDQLRSPRPRCSSPRTTPATSTARSWSSTAAPR